jgi:cation:H+ antiporter
LSPAISVIVFVASLAAVSIASGWLTTSLERIGARLRFSEALLGLVTALAADLPEISSAFAAILSNYHDVGWGVVLGSNVFNLAGLLGLSTVVAGKVAVGRQGLAINGGVGILVAASLMMLILGWLSAQLALLLLSMLVVPYIFLCALQTTHVQRSLLPRRVKAFLETAVGHLHRAAKRKEVAHASRMDVIRAAVSMAIIVACSMTLVRSAVAIANNFGLNQAIVGTLILAALTSVPNVVVAVRLALEGRGEAVVSETFNSNTLNAVVGVCVPAVLFGIGTPSNEIRFTAIWLFGMTIVSVVSAGIGGGLRRINGATIIVLYFIFAFAVVLWR